MKNFSKTQKSNADYQKRKIEAWENLKKLHLSFPLPPMPINWLTEDRK